MDLSRGGSPPDAPLRVWALSDGRAGIENQALGVAEAVARLVPADITVKRVRWRRWLRRLPTRAIALAQAARDPVSDPVAPPWPDLLIGNGRAAIPFAVAMRRWSKGAAFVVQLQDPLRSPRLFDLVAPPLHDGLEGPGVFPILGAPHRVTRDRLEEAASRFSALAALPRPRVAFLVGGRSRAFDLPGPLADDLAGRVAAAAWREGGSVMATLSRRTPAAAAAAIRARLHGPAALTWDGEGENPYFAMLALADHVVVTEDSVNMATEAAFTGKPVHVAAIAGRQARKDRFYADLAARGVARPFDGALPTWRYAPLDETSRLAAEVVRRLSARAIDARRPQGDWDASRNS